MFIEPKATAITQPLLEKQKHNGAGTKSEEKNSVTAQVVLEQENLLIRRQNEEQVMIQTSMLSEMLQKFVSGSPDVEGAALVSPDGLPLGAVLPQNMDEERTAAMSAAMLSLGERIGSELSRGIIEKIFIEGEKGYAVMVGCSQDAVLLVLAGKEAKQGILFLEIKRIVGELASMLG